jgi:DNA-binding transcriptional regulator YdaS (Cro superfamily)
VQIERATAGAVTRRDLRPDDWGDIWPELIDDEHPWPSREQEAA